MRAPVLACLLALSGTSAGASDFAAGLAAALRALRAEPAPLSAPAAIAGAPAAAHPDLPNFVWVADDYYRGGQPSKKGLAMLKRLGIRTVLDLRNDPQGFEPGEVRRLGLRYTALPMSASKPPPDAVLEAFLALIRDPAAGPVFVHCLRGADRTGLVSAVRRMELDGWEPLPAAREMVELGGLSPKLIRHVFVYYQRRHPGYEIPDLRREFPAIFK